MRPGGILPPPSVAVRPPVWLRFGSNADLPHLQGQAHRVGGRGVVTAMCRPALTRGWRAHCPPRTAICREDRGPASAWRWVGSPWRARKQPPRHVASGTMAPRTDQRSRPAGRYDRAPTDAGAPASRWSRPTSPRPDPPGIRLRLEQGLTSTEPYLGSPLPARQGRAAAWLRADRAAG